MDKFSYNINKFCSFIVRNISPQHKTIKIFDTPIIYQQQRNLLRLPGISEEIIKASLLKGELKHKLLVKDIVIISSDLDLIQFNLDQRTFLQSNGIDLGLSVGGSGNLSYVWKQEIALLGLKNDDNQTFYTPDKFLNGPDGNGNDFHINLSYNGKEIYEEFDYQIFESDGPNTGFNGVQLMIIVPPPGSLIFADYVLSI